jgi:hypothetical protein
VRLGPLVAPPLAVVLPFATQAGPQSAQPRRLDRRGKGVPDELSEQTGALIDLSRAVPPDFAADALARIAGSRLLSDPLPM